METKTTMNDDEDDDMFWAGNGDIIDQMVAQHEMERQTQERKRANFGVSNTDRTTEELADWTRPPRTAFKRVEEIYANPTGAIPGSRSVDGGVPPSQPSYNDMLAEKDGLVSILRDRLGKAEVETVRLRQRLQEVTNNPARTIVEKSAALHLEQQVQQLKQQLAFKEEEIAEARRLRLQREEKLHHAEEVASKFAATVKQMEATNATAEAESLLRRQAFSVRKSEPSGSGHLAGKKGNSARAHVILEESRRTSGVSLTWSPSHSFGGNRASDAQEGLFWHSQNVHSNQGAEDLVIAHTKFAKECSLQNSAKLIATITSHKDDDDELQEGLTARALCDVLEADGSPTSITHVLLEFVRKFGESFGKGPCAAADHEEYIKCILFLMRNILESDYFSRAYVASCISAGESVEEDQSDELLRILRDILKSALNVGDIAAAIFDILSMAITSLEPSKRRTLSSIVSTSLAEDSVLQSLANRQDVRQAVLTFLYYSLECAEIFMYVVEDAHLLKSLFHILQTSIDIEQSPDRNGDHDSRTFTVCRQAFGICALIHRHLVEPLDLKTKAFVASSSSSSASAYVLSRLGKILVHLLKFIDGVLCMLENKSMPMAQVQRHNLVLSLQESLCLLHTLFSSDNEMVQQQVPALVQAFYVLTRRMTPMNRSTLPFKYHRTDTPQLTSGAWGLNSPAHTIQQLSQQVYQHFTLIHHNTY